MTKNKMNPQVDTYLKNATVRKKEMEKLRDIILDCHLTEAFKWGKPCYTYENKNIVIIQGFKAYCALLFFKGYLLPDPQNILVKTGKNTRIGRQIRFNNIEEIVEKESLLKQYIQEAITIEKSTLKNQIG